MTEDEKYRIISAFERWIIEDPYPNLTEWDMLNKSLGPIERLLGGAGTRPYISAHQAWMDGYKFAKKLVTDAL